jgi:protein O-mannosyl-transferase
MGQSSEIIPFLQTRAAAWLAVCLIALATAAAYANSLGGPFIFDDFASIPENPTIRDLGRIVQVLSPPPHGETVSGRPLLNLSFALDYALDGTNVRVYHATNLAIHVMAALLLFGVLRRTFLLPKLRERWGQIATLTAFAVALFWAVHPLQTESVTYIVQRAESLAGLFYLLTLYCVIRGAGIAMDPRHPIQTDFWCIMAILACLLGMATKEVVASAPLIVLLYDRAFLSDSFAQVVRKRWGLYASLAATWGLLAYGVFSSGWVFRGAELGAVDPWSYARTQPEVILYYLRLSLWPSELCLDYGWPMAAAWHEIVPGALILVALLAATLWCLSRGNAWGVLGAWFFLILAPSSSVVPLPAMINEHRMYLPLAAIITAIVMGAIIACKTLASRGRVFSTAAGILGGGLLAAIAAALAIATIQRNEDYRSNLSIWLATARAAPRNDAAYNNIGVALTVQGRFDEAVENYDQALNINPRNVKARNNLANALLQSDRIDEAIPHLEQVLAIEPDFAEAHYHLANALAEKGRSDEAIEHYQIALDLKLLDPDLYHNLGSTLARQNRFAEAVGAYQKALEVNPDSAEAHNNLGLIYYQLGRGQEALAHWRAALRLQPDNMIALTRTAWCLATHEDASLRDGKEAVELAQRAVRLSQAKSPILLYTLAAACAEAGRFPEAVDAAKLAVDLAKAENNPALANEIQQQFNLFQRGMPFRETKNATGDKTRP